MQTWVKTVFGNLMMNDELERSLLGKYPAIFGKYTGSVSRSTYCNVECGNGWHNLLDTLCHDIQAYVDTEHVQQVNFIQVKGKFGELRIYYNLVDKYVDDLIKEAGRQSKLICEYCGNVGSYQKISSGWMQTVCPDCR